MQHNPFAVRMSKRAAPAKSEDLPGIIDRVTDELVAAQSGLIAKVESGQAARATLEAEIVKIIDKLENKNLPTRDTIISSVINSIFGYGPLEPYLTDSEISDLYVNGPDSVYIKKKGEKIPISINFGDNKRLLSYCRKVCALCGGRINENEAEVVVTDRKRNLRIVVSIEPINIGAPSLVIRKPTTGYVLSDLISSGMIDETLKDHLVSAVKSKETIIISGKGGSGKTTLLGALINEVPGHERGLLIQETNEITLRHPDIVSQLIKITETPGAKNYNLFDLTRFGLLMGIDRMFIGELKDREAFDFFNAVFTGHNGSMATVHANSAEETIDRLVLLMKRANTDLSGDYLKELLVSSLNLVVFMKDYKVKEVSRVNGLDAKTGRIVYKKLFSLDGKGGFRSVGTGY